MTTTNRAKTQTAKGGKAARRRPLPARPAVVAHHNPWHHGQPGSRSRSRVFVDLCQRVDAELRRLGFETEWSLSGPYMQIGFKSLGGFHRFMALTNPAPYMTWEWFVGLDSGSSLPAEGCVPEDGLHELLDILEDLPPGAGEPR